MFAPGFRNALKSRSLAHIQRLATQLDDARNLDPSTRSSSLHEAAKSGRADVFSWLLLEQQHEHAEISQDARGETVLHVAAEHGETEILELYLEFYPFVIDWVNAYGATPLHLAAVKGQTEAAKLLIQHGADIDAPDLNGDTPLHFASSWGQLDTIKLLIESNATSNAQNNQGFTPSSYAFSFTIVEALQDLIKTQKRTKKKISRIASTTSTSSTLSSRKPSFATTLHPITIPYPVSGWTPSVGTSIVNPEDDSITPSTSPNMQANDFRFADKDDKPNPSSYLLARSNSLAVPDHSSNYSGSVASSSPYLSSGDNGGAAAMEQFVNTTSPLLPSPTPSPTDLPSTSPPPLPSIASTSAIPNGSTTAQSIRTDSFDSVKPSRRALLALEHDASQSRSYDADPGEGGRNRSQSNSTFGTITSSENDSAVDSVEESGASDRLNAGQNGGGARGAGSGFLGGNISNRGSSFVNTIGKSINRARSSSHLSINSSAPSFPPTVQHFQSSNATNTQTNVVSPLAANPDGSPINPASGAVARSKSHSGGRRSRASSTSISIVPLLLPPSNNPITPPLPVSPTPSGTAQSQADIQAHLVPPTAVPLPLSPSFPPSSTISTPGLLSPPSLLPATHPASLALSRNPSSSNSVHSEGTTTPGKNGSAESSRAGSMSDSKVSGEIRRGSEGLGRLRGIFGRKKEKD